MAYKCKALADSISPIGHRITTLEVTYPRIVHAEFMTHRQFSRNAASSRAIPISKMIEQVVTDPFIPIWWGKNQSGMAAQEELEGACLELVQKQWLLSRDMAVQGARQLSGFGLHKQIANRLLEPWMWITVIVTATEWDNFFNLRISKFAQPEIRHAAEIMKAARDKSIPIKLEYGQWHMPFTDGFTQNFAIEEKIKISVGRCARVSYLTHAGDVDPFADMDLHDKLLAAGHMSPFEHVAMCEELPHWSGNFFGWKQYRKTIIGESNIVAQKKEQDGRD